MGILYKTYNGKHQLHFYREVWIAKSKPELENILSNFAKKEAAKAKITVVGKNMEIELNGLIMDCRDLSDLKFKFGYMVDLKVKYQKTSPAPKK